VLGGLPAHFPVPVLVVQHFDPRHQTIIADVRGRRAQMPVRLASEGELPWRDSTLRSRAADAFD
jgi:two-component system chemotaxis response regulator CheB